MTPHHKDQMDAHTALIGLICDDIAEGGDGSRVFNAAREELEKEWER